MTQARAPVALRLVLGALCAGAVAISLAAEPAASDEKLRQLLQRASPQADTGSPGYAVPGQKAVVPATRLEERAELLQTGEAALSRLDVREAMQAFDRAALILHAADTEIALVRTYMQAGEYRRALAFGAHTAGAHLDVLGGSALYAWLLHVGGQEVVAQRLLSEAEARGPGSTFLREVQTQLKSGKPVASGNLLSIPARLAPYGQSKGVPASARVVGSGLLVAGGKQALVPLALVPPSGRFWLRNGLGHLSIGTLERRLPEIGVALVRLENELPAPENLWITNSAAFPGSVAYALEYVTSRHADPAWPVLRAGFLGAGSGNTGERKLGVAMPTGPRGGPVFNAAGHLIGLALPGELSKNLHGKSEKIREDKTRGSDRLISTSQIQAAFSALISRASAIKTAATLGSSPPPEASPRASTDQIYEISLRASLQLIAVP